MMEVAVDVARVRLLSLINAAWSTQVLYATCKLGLPDHLADGCTRAAALAQRCGAQPAAVRRLLRGLAALGACEDLGDDRFQLSALGELLCRDHEASMREWALQVGGPQWQRWGELTESVQTGRSWRLRREGEDGFAALSADEDDAQAFHRAMGEMTRPVARALLQRADWQGVPHLVDVGGGSGAMLAVLLQGLPLARGTLFDQPNAAQWAAPVLEGAGVASRCRCVAGSFFDEVPAGGDVLLLKSVLHNWDDERSLQILRRCRASMGAGARLMVLERLLPERMGCTTHDQAVARSDLNMLVALSGRERRLREYEVLLAEAGFGPVAAVPLNAEWTVLSAGVHAG
jgi:hypothetical protein